MEAAQYLVESVSTILSKNLAYDASIGDIRDAIESKNLMRMRGTRQSACRELLIRIYCDQDEDRCRELITEMMTEDYGFSQLLHMATENHLWSVCEYLEAVHDLCRACISQERAEIEIVIQQK
jgi:hypothetical protein